MASLSPLSWMECALLLALIGAFGSASAHSLADARYRAVFFSGLVFCCTAAAWLDFTYFEQFSEGQGFRWLPHMVGSGVLAVDLLNAPLLPITALLCLVIIAVTLKTRIRRFSFARTLVLEACLLATLSAYASWVLIVMLGVVALPQAHELHIRGRSGRVFAIHMGVSMVFLVVGWFLVTYDWIWLGYSLAAIAIAIRAGLFPAHCWVIDIFENAAFGTALITLSPLIAVYAAIRLLLPGAPAIILYVLACMALVTALYSAAMSTIQSDARRYVCYFLLSLSSLVLAGTAFSMPLGMTASLFLWLSIPISIMGLGLTIRALEARTGRLSMHEFRGFHAQTPTLAAFFLVTGLAAVGFPGTLGFFGLEMLTDAATQSSKTFGFLVIASSALSGIAVLRVYSIVFLGKHHHATVDLHIRPVELLSFLALVLLMTGGTLWPQPGIDSCQKATEMIFHLRQEYQLVRFKHHDKAH